MEENMTSAAVVAEIETFLADWRGEEQPMRDWFRLFYRELVSMDNVALSFVGRPGVSYSLRPRHDNQKNRDLFAIVDVIDDDQDARWLSVCFYGDMITDPKEHGETIPGGLAGSDGYCFDLYDNDQDLAMYLLERLREAAAAAAAGS